MIVLRILTVAMICLAATSVDPLRIAVAQEENTGPNINVVREVGGTLRLQTASDKRFRGVEEWRIFVHADGSRTMTLTKDFIAANALQIMTAHVDADFRPIDVYATYWTLDGYRGSIRAAVDGNELRAVSEGPYGRIEDVVEVPHELSIVTHGESMNGWYLWQGERDDEGIHRATYFNFNPAPDGSALVKGRLHPATYEYFGTETVTVPAGTFATERYLLGNIDIWYYGEDRVLVKQSLRGDDKEYILTKLELVTPE
ncbi:MAG: hypothetical protein P8L79_08740 [Rhodospirillaceae bacterium]|jgi:hypothetical protein|nr:hypothetical protein [Rhodospirillaceae bacterium]